jgi:ectoine hydroxylase
MTMKLTAEQVQAYDRDGFLVLPGVYSTDEIGAMREEIRRLSTESADAIREKDGKALRMFYRIHDERAETPSTLFQRVARSPRMLGPARQVLGDDELYMYHSKCNVKEAISGDIWQWHQDFGSWTYDGMPTPNVATILVVVEQASELGGCLYMVPGSHKLGLQSPEIDHETTSYKLRVVPKERMIEILGTLPRPVAITAPAGSIVLFHGNMIHASGHNLWKDPRWHLYFVYNPVRNQTRAIENPRPEHVRSIDFRPLVEAPDELLSAQPA